VRLLDAHNLLQRPTDALGFMTVILWRSNQWHVSATQLAICRLARTSI